MPSPNNSRYYYTDQTVSGYSTITTSTSTTSGSMYASSEPLNFTINTTPLTVDVRPIRVSWNKMVEADFSSYYEEYNPNAIIKPKNKFIQEEFDV